ncbi:MAG: hypothetical protein K6C94_05670 [Candidatus Gastranaerophilales bacterium]|nr:hypothetical protein [Candidatus Gastranaerophilales bacterium]
MNVNPINAVSQVTNNTAIHAKKEVQEEQALQAVEEQVTAQPSAELYRAALGIKKPVQKQEAGNDDPYGARAFLDNHPVSPFVKGEDRENLINAMEKGNVETSNIEMQLALIADEKLTPQTLSHYWKTGKMCDQMEADIDMMYDCYANGKKVEDVYVPNVANKEEGTKAAKIGDVFQVEGEDRIYVKDDEDKAHQLKMDKETFIKLFPPAQRFASAQYAIGDCYCVATLNSVMEEPKTRIALYDAIEQDGNDIHVKYPNGKADYLAKNGELKPETNQKMVLRGAQGVRLLEDAFGLELQAHAEDDFRTIMQQKIADKKAQYQAETDPREKAIMKKDWLGMRQRLADFEESMKDPKNKTVVLRDDLGDRIAYKEDRYGMMFAPLKEAPENRDKNGAPKFTTQKEFYRGSLGGYQHQVMNMLGIEGKIMNTEDNKEEILEFLKGEPSGKYMICGGTFPDGTRTENPVARDKGVYSFHAYTLEAVKDNEGELKLRASNPWNTAVDADLSVEDTMKFFQVFEVYDINSYKGIQRQDA